MNILIDNIRVEVNYKNNLPTWNRQIDSSNSGGIKKNRVVAKYVKKRESFRNWMGGQDFTAILAAFSEIKNPFTLFEEIELAPLPQAKGFS